jgi:hypothetical protein
MGAKGPDLIGDGNKKNKKGVREKLTSRDNAGGLGPLRRRFTTNPRWSWVVKICTLDPLLGLFLWLVALACVLSFCSVQIRVAGGGVGQVTKVAKCDSVGLQCSRDVSFLLRPVMGMGSLRSLQDVRVQLSRRCLQDDDKPRTCWMDRCRLLTVAFQNGVVRDERRPPSAYKGALTSLSVVCLGCCVAPVRMLNGEWLGIATITCFFQLLQREYAGRFLQRVALSLGRPRAAAPVSLRTRLLLSRLVLV